MTASFPNLPPESRPLGGRYRLMQPLGLGGFGQTFSAQDLHLPGHPLCVVKQLKPQVTTAEELQTARRLFDTEAQTLYKLGTHPQIPGLLAHFEEGQEFYLAQELIEGHSLAEELDTPWTEAQVAAFLGDLLGILTFVHSHGVIHRDIKPSNLIRRASDSRIVLIDFGAVKQVSAQATALRSGLSHTISIGTQGYMPSEQVAGRPQFSSDIYAVGILGIQALTGYPPTELHPDPRSGELEWQQYAPQANPALLDVLEVMVRYDFRTRYTTAVEALAALRNLPPALSRYVPAAPVPQGQSPRTTAATVAIGRRRERTQLTAAQVPAAQVPVRRREPSSTNWVPLAAGALAAVVVAIAGLLGWQAWRSASSTPEDETPVVSTAPTVDSPADAEPTVVEPEPEAEAPAAPREAAVESAEAEPEAPAAPEPEVVDAPEAEVVEPEAPAPPAPAGGGLTPEAAQATVATLYSHVSSKSWDAARSQFSGSLAQQFDPGFFAQFDRVSVENLRVTGQTADSINFVGENTYVYPDGSTQREQRSFTVQMIDGQPRIVGSSFGGVLESR
ncbi:MULTISPECIES: serine/threonine-protein kinase [Cyanophyceae]|uniref:serine/threonine-protein kinase n=1 Tax=Cyanophyceae TaxID=3028117 RepID=UPI00168A1B6D|nr:MULTISPECIES: serine/threonine-protein kinase [Cyanophyceae]MBD1915612.1 serine/threonine protein kinase [Phormidium sp. FACHB-77]MBD2031922.1 serine/threonine protein kinase [Phormidium sp. FACHB-322]MBD2050672.1 serine/threonine protein kinase [Leptolyngbya sp. FACHB-60]